MRILSRYVLREFLIPFSYCFFGMIFLYILFTSFDVISAFFQKQPPMEMVLQYFAGSVAQYLEWLLPAVFLLATLYTMWQFCRNNELMAMRASGIGFLTIVSPILVVAMLCAGLSFLNSEFYAPVAGARAQEIKKTDFVYGDYAIKRNIGYNAHNANHAWLIGEFNVTDRKHLKSVAVTFFRPDGSKHYTLSADAADYLDGEWWLSGNLARIEFDELGNILGNVPWEAPPDFRLDTALVSETPDDIFDQNKGSTEFDSIRDQKRYIKQTHAISREDKLPRKYNIYRRYASPIAIIVITLFAIPAGIASARQSVFRGIILAIALFLSYYVLNSLCMVIATRGILTPALSAFLPCILFSIAGGVLFYRQR